MPASHIRFLALRLKAKGLKKSDLEGLPKALPLTIVPTLKRAGIIQLVKGTRQKTRDPRVWAPGCYYKKFMESM